MNPQDRPKAIVLLVLVVAVFGFVIMRFMGSKGAPTPEQPVATSAPTTQAPGQPAAGGPGPAPSSGNIREPLSDEELAELHGRARHVLGAQHVATGRPILYTSADSVFQIAAHEDVVPVDDLYHMCRVARKLLVPPHQVARVIARPFTGSPGAFVRTERRRDFSLAPPHETLLDKLASAGQSVIGIGKIDDLFAGQGLTRSIHTGNNAAGLDETFRTLKAVPRGLIFVNLVDFDMLYGHRNDAAGYAKALEQFDRRLPELFRLLRPGDLLCVTADHGNDPTHPGTDHTREYVPLLAYGPRLARGVAAGPVRGEVAGVVAQEDRHPGHAERGPDALGEALREPFQVEVGVQLLREAQQRAAPAVALAVEHAVDRVLVEAGLDERLAQQLDRGVAVLGEEPGRDGHGVIVRAEGEPGGECLARFREGPGVEFARALLEKPGHQVDGAALSGRIDGRSAEEPQFQRHEGQGAVLDQPGADAAGRGHVLDGDRSPCGQGRDKGREGNQKALHSCASAVRSSQPVTDRAGTNTSRAAATTSSAVTAWRMSGQASTSAIVRPEASPSP